jgi:hypothetical protein
MSIFNGRITRDVGKAEKRFEVSTTLSDAAYAMDKALLREVVKELSGKIVDHIYPDVIKALDQELIVKEVSIAVSERVIATLYGKEVEL